MLTNTQTAESLVKHYETKLCEEEAVTADKNNIENLMGTLKVRAGWCLFMGKSKKKDKSYLSCNTWFGYAALYSVSNFGLCI